MEDNFDDPKLHDYLSEGPGYDECQHCGATRAEHRKEKNKKLSVKDSGHRSTFSDYNLQKSETIEPKIIPPDPRGEGPVEDIGEMRNGQPNIIDYSNQEPLLYGLGQNSSHEYPGKIVINNESRYIDREVKKNTIPGPAATGSESVGSDTTQPTLPTGAPLVMPPESETDHNMHGLNFNNKIKWNEAIVVPPKEEKTHVEKLPEVDPQEEGLHNTGKDLSRTGPEGTHPKENYDTEHFQGMSDTKLNIATPYYNSNNKKIYDVSGTPPELQDKTSDQSETFSFKETVDGKLPEGNENEESFTHSSSWIGNVRYFPKEQTMDVTMNGKKYSHCGVSHKDFEQFKGAPSKGEHWNRIIKDRFQCGSGLSEALNIYKDKQPGEFNWIVSKDIEEMKEYAKKRGKGKFILAVASGESITDHRIEGTETLRRKWTEKELMQNIRTAKGKLLDINHNVSKIDPHSGGVYDANWNDETKRGEMAIWESDEVILQAIRDNKISAVSINTGPPRKIQTNCNSGECFLEPEGTVLGEINGVALAYVVTDPSGMDYHGQHIDPLPPGMQITKIYLVE